jgi:DNA-binding response OmpR family regulator
MRLNGYSGEMNVHILIVEDSHTQAEQLRHVLESNHYKVTIAYNGEEALDFLQKTKPTIVISDVIMPGMDGYELCRKIKQSESIKGVPVILLTQLSSPHDIIRGLECGADHFITKPYNRDYLLSHIQYIFVNRELRKTAMADLGIEIFFAGQKHFLTSDRIQILDLLFSTYEAVMQKNHEFDRHDQETQRVDTDLLPLQENTKRQRILAAA